MPSPTNNQLPTTNNNNRQQQQPPHSRTVLSRSLPEIYISAVCLSSLTDACCIKLKTSKKHKDAKRRHRNKFDAGNTLPDYGVEEWRDGAQGKYYISCILPREQQPRCPGAIALKPLYPLSGHLCLSGILWPGWIYHYISVLSIICIFASRSQRVALSFHAIHSWSTPPCDLIIWMLFTFSLAENLDCA